MQEIFSTFVTETVRDFPQLKDWLIIVDVTTGQRAGNIDLERMGPKGEAVLKELLEKEAAAAKEKGSGTVLSPIKHKPALICFNSPMKITASDEYNTMAELDHELGHIVVKNAIDPFTTYASENFKECAADIYCALRHIQRYGEDTGFLDRLIWKRAMDFMQSGSDKHFTSLTLQDMKPLLAKIDIAAMTAQEVADISWTIASRYTLQEKPINRVKTAFTDVSKGRSLPETLKIIAEAVCADNADYYTVRTGLAAVMPYLETGRTLQGAHIELAGDEWKRLRQALAEKEFRLSSEDILFNTPKRRAAPKPSGCPPRP